MASQEYQFCQIKNNQIIFDVLSMLKGLKANPRLSIANIFNVFIVARDCFIIKSDSWLIKAHFQTTPLALTIPVKKRKLPDEEIAFMAKCYEESKEDDLALAKECEGMDSDFDDCSSE
jgi:hypothetical protein